jgi:hypothetical protein
MMRAKSIRLLGSLVFLFLFNAGFAGLGDWTTYTNMNEINDVLLKGDQLWCATTGGV